MRFAASVVFCVFCMIGSTGMACGPIDQDVPGPRCDCGPIDQDNSGPGCDYPPSLGDSDGSLSLNATVAPFFEVDFPDGEVTYTVTEVLTGDEFSSTIENLRFRVHANVPFIINVTFPTWQPPAPAPQNFLQGEFSNGAYRIAGTLFLDPTPDQASHDDDVVFQSSDGQLSVSDDAFGGEWGLGANLFARFTDNPIGLPEPGVYSLDAEITVLPQ